jgi:predicted AAA+ superfamily ATPase
VYPFSQSKGDEIGKTPKIFFYDIGLQNALINNFDSIHIRDDAGALFENFIMTELYKTIQYQDLDYTLNYWRLKSGAEIDIVMSNHRELYGIEVKLHKGKITKVFANRYQQAKTRLVTRENFY